MCPDTYCRAEIRREDVLLNIPSTEKDSCPSTSSKASQPLYIPECTLRLIVD